MRFNEFNKITEDIGLPTEKSVTDTLGSYRPGSDKKVWGTGKTAKPLAPVAGPEKIHSGNTEYYNVTKDDPLSKVRPGVGQTPNVSTSVTPPTTTVPQAAPRSTYNTGFDAGRKVRAGLDSLKAGGGLNSLKAGAQALGKSGLGKVLPVAGTALSAADSLRRYKDQDYTGAAISGAGALASMVPGVGVPLSLGAAGYNAYRDATKPKSTQPVQQVQQAPSQQAPVPQSNSSNDQERSTYTTDQQAIKNRIAATQAQQPQQSQQNTIQPPVQPRQPRQSYAGTAGAQAIQRANPDIIKNVNDISAGDTINLPGGGQYTIKPGDTLDKIAQNQPTAQAPALTPRIPITQTQSSNTPTTTTNTNAEPSDVRGPFDDKGNYLWKGAGEKVPSNTSTNTTKPVVAPPTQAEDTNPLHRIKSLAGLK